MIVSIWQVLCIWLSSSSSLKTSDIDQINQPITQLAQAMQQNVTLAEEAAADLGARQAQAASRADRHR
ncbi:hypothetical protein [Noviherbaspirillum autotrophicum]|uniref:Uncharacterized protein n=1 Tax=Noviherbaspirillum autotrophicum TaxID=709839 RepID=A0A0C1YPI2_9BURK|nr:hypothetical protein [Noviherbaspirillum autotrophicum]KIF82472.1 hypothetical protein TSA66_19255 [Noviherbaspirillum autotrophicum]